VDNVGSPTPVPSSGRSLPVEGFEQGTLLEVQAEVTGNKSQPVSRQRRARAWKREHTAQEIQTAMNALPTATWKRSGSSWSSEVDGEPGQDNTTGE
jgi:hypothetical protein